MLIVNAAVLLYLVHEKFIDKIQEADVLAFFNLPDDSLLQYLNVCVLHALIPFFFFFLTIHIFLWYTVL